MNEQSPPDIHYTELQPAHPESPLAIEWETYRSQVARLLAEGQEGRHVLIKGQDILGIWDSHDHAMEEGHRHFLLQPFLVHQIQTRERVFRSGYLRTCRT